MPSTTDLVGLLDRLLGPGSEEVAAAPDARRVLLALDPPDPAVVAGAGADAVLLHRSWGFEPPPGVGVVACHDPFDRALGLAHNRWLHADLGLTGTEPLAAKATLHACPPDVAARVRATFAGLEREHGAPATAERVVLADAMTDDLVRRAAAAGAGVYVTGSWRVPGADAVGETGIGVLVVGHRRQERSSLGLLARLLVQDGYEPVVRMRERTVV